MLEGTDMYDQLADILTEYAKKTGQYNKRLQELRSLYEGKKGYETDLEKKLQKELVADLVGDYIFTDEDFVKQLYMKDNSVFDKVLNEIKYMLNIATAGSEEARQLEKAKKTFEDAYRSPGNVRKNTAAGVVDYSISYEDAIDKLANGTLDRSKNTHLLVSDHTPQILIDKAGAKDFKIVTGWDTAYLAMNKEGELPGNYHSLGANVMKAIPKALEDPLYIVKQNNGRINAVTEVVVKGNRPVLVSVELDAFKTLTLDGAQEADNYNLIVTFFDAKSSYLQNKVFSGEVKYNKNNEDPAHFISRLKSL